jgi:hypothetical protein
MKKTKNKEVTVTIENAETIETIEAVETVNAIETVVVTEKRRGRPIVEGSNRQLDLAAKASRVEANGGVVRKGRPTNGTSARQMRLAAKEALKAAGVVIKPGRPKMVKVEETVVTETIVAEA